ncbi:MAG TPA: serine/threonine-protein kinase [Gemmatimonadales bacterium]|jgi:serine/threonine-protein kinase|nr:serine/threonine-protein kinase [Gemmatimonadales bacterium]
MPETTEPNLPELRRALAGAYEIEAPIARGGMGFVYLARERRLDRRVAIKVLPPDLAVDAGCRRRFLREARTAAGLTHPNIVPIFAVDESGVFVFFAMAYVAGETLTQRVATRGPLNAEEAARLLHDIGDALAYAHARGIVHRDVKPDNILLDAATGRALLSDFGIAHVSPRGRPAAAPRTEGRVLGTAAFMSPEQARGDPVDARSDVYSLGVVAYYALSGRLPFDAATDAALLALHIGEPAPPLVASAPWVPPRLAQIVDRCLAKDPWARFADTATLVRAVADAVEPPAAPLAVRAFLVRSKHLAEPARIHAALTGLVLLPAAVATWLSPSIPALRATATAALAVALLAPLAVAIARVRRLVAVGHRREDLVAALTAHRARRLEELAFVYGSGPTGVERVLQWLARLALAVATVAGVGLTTVELPPQLTLLLPPVAAGAAGTALLAAIAARSRTEQRTDPPGERRLRFWRGPLGRALFRLAAFGVRPTSPIVTILGKLETPA